MKVYEFIKTHSNTLEQMMEYSLRPGDVHFLIMYKDYHRLLSEGHKKTYIICYLSEQYNVDERTVYRIVKRFSKEIAV